ncbi:hypothetical protein [Legionella parisiensis]|uniref:Uncharacterized protein n=1 Tax=Legionella parisiensis TaxID=45071 RepID=A0A1E5JWR2_9GAMM|nr:hypothetical protein [Legionella parisiensis]KTD44388.1 hypothetical protein Lpar_0474 [Legionella parisiensis]OEH48952.1 hypothetical protein lpari_00004 [Legionella parisiensis]STX72015.1 Uncharacterised protein [Legionella parisiensis]
MRSPKILFISFALRHVYSAETTGNVGSFKIGIQYLHHLTTGYTNAAALACGIPV